MSWLHNDDVRTGHVREQRGGNILSVGEVVERALLVDDAHGSLLGADADALDVVRSLAHSLQLLVQDARSLDSRLRVELGRVGDLEEDVLHDVGAERHLELKWFAL